MFGLGKMDPAKMQAMMKKMGIKTENIEASEVIIKSSSGDIKIKNPTVTQIDVQGQKTFQIVGEVAESCAEEDVKLIMEQTGAARAEAEKVLAETGDLATAILKLKKD